MKDKKIEPIEIEKILTELDKEELRLRNEAITEGYKDERCPKCKTVFLAHKHLVRCEHAPHGNCPMVTDTESLLDKLCPEKNNE